MYNNYGDEVGTICCWGTPEETYLLSFLYIYMAFGVFIQRC